MEKEVKIAKHRRTFERTAKTSEVCLCAESVLANRDVLSLVFAYLVDNTAPSRRQLCSLRAVCSGWKGMAEEEKYWNGIARCVLPISFEQETSRSRIMNYGRALINRRVFTADDIWKRLSLSFEVLDKSKERPRLLSVVGNEVVARSALRPDGTEYINIILQGPNRVEVRGEPFSAASMDPLHRRYADIRQYFQQSHREGSPSSLCVRVMAYDKVTGKKALIYEGGQNLRRNIVEPSPWTIPYLPAGSFRVFEDSYIPITCFSPCPVFAALKIHFYVIPEPGQDLGACDQKDLLYRLAGGDDLRYKEHCSFVGLAMDGGVENAARFLWSLLL